MYNAVLKKLNHSTVNHVRCATVSVIGNCCIPSVIVEVRYAGVDRAAGLLRETGIKYVWTLKN
jgi:hypothetical protein